jgi:hypothetical protein
MVTPPVHGPQIELGPLVSRKHVIERARSWLRPIVPYSQTAFHISEYGHYRADCSGYVSMAWALPGKPASRHGGLNTLGLAAVSFIIGKDELLPGDVLLRANGTPLTRHAVIFSAWIDVEQRAYWGFEQAGGTGTTYRIIEYPYEHGTHHYQNRRYINLNNRAICPIWTDVFERKP